jgi:hypothetical protein
MQNVKINGTIDTSADNVWELVSDFGGLDIFVEAVERCTVKGQGAGAVRTLTLQDGGKVEEKLESFDNDKMVLEYSILESPMPIKNYTGRMEVNKLNDNQSEFIWSSTFEAEDGTERDMKKALAGLYSVGVEGLKERFS